jgi:hypothetical protein
MTDTITGIMQRLKVVEDYLWKKKTFPTGPGNVVGPTSATNGNLAVFDGITGKIIKDGGTISAYAPQAHSLLSIYHNDTTAGPVQRGDLIYGHGATPSWARLGKGALNTILQMGADEPGWSTGTLSLGGFALTVPATGTAALGAASSTASSTNDVSGATHTHAIDSTIARSAVTITAGAGLTGGGDLTANRTLTVGAGTLITVAADDVGITPGAADYGYIGSTTTPWTAGWRSLSTLAGAGLTHTAGVLAVGAGVGITVNADDVALTTPGTLTVATTNSSTGSHTHAVTSSANPGAAASILASDANGYLQLVRLGIGITPGYPLHVIGDARIDGDLTFVGAQSIKTTSDNLTLAPAADLDLTPGGTARVRATAGVRLQSDNYVSQTTGWGISYAGSGDFRYLYADELHAKAFIADLEQALAGGQIISKSVAPLAVNFVVPNPGENCILVVESFKGYITFQVFVDGDIVRLRQFDRTGTSLTIANCWGTVTWLSTSLYNIIGTTTSYIRLGGDHVAEFTTGIKFIIAGSSLNDGTWTTANAVPYLGDTLVYTVEVLDDGSTGGYAYANQTQTYLFTRSAAPNAGAATVGSTMGAGSLVLDYGTTGNGFLESNAIDGAMAEYAPYHQIVSWATHPATGLTVRTRLGNLKGIFNVSNEYGLYAGAGVTDADQYLRVSNTAVEAHNLPIKMYDGASVTMQFSPTAPSFAMGSTLPSAYGTGDGLWMGKDTAYKFRVGDVDGEMLAWDGSTLRIYATTTNYLEATGTSLTLNAGGQSRIALSSAGVLTVNDSAGAPVITLDASAGAEITKKLTMPGANSAIAIGATPPTAANAGTGIWIDRTGLYGLNANVPQAYINATGQLMAGAGKVAIDVNGISITSTTGVASDRAYKFVSGATVLSGMYSYLSASWNSASIYTNAVAGISSDITLFSSSPADKNASVTLHVDRAGAETIAFTLLSNTAGMHKASLDGGYLTIGYAGALTDGSLGVLTGINVGTATGAAAGCISVSGLASLTTPAESWIGPSATAGVYFKGGYAGYGTTNPLAILQAEGATHLVSALTLANLYSYATFAVTQATSHYGMYMGADASSGDSWIQVDNGATAYRLILQPLGGSVLVPGIKAAAGQHNYVIISDDGTLQKGAQL